MLGSNVRLIANQLKMKSTVHGEKLIERTCHGHSDVTSDNAVTARNAFGCPWLDGLEYPIAQRVVTGLGGVPHSDLGFLDGEPVPGSGGELDVVHLVGRGLVTNSILFC